MIGILLMPVFLELLGTESFGLIGFFLMLQSWLQVADLGFSPTLSREMSLYKAGAMSSAAAWQRLRSLEWLLGCLAFSVVTIFIIWRYEIVTSWLSFELLSSEDVAFCVVLMIIAAAARWLTGLYRSGLIGMERQILVNGLGVLFVSLKFLGVLPLLVLISASPIVFFVYQLFAGILELFVFIILLYRLIPGSAMNVLPSWSALTSMFSIAGAMAFLSSMWIFITQIDKLILSRLLTLEEYGYYTLAVMLAGSLFMLVAPLNQVLQPRMTILISQGNCRRLDELYLQATQLITVVFVAIGSTLAIFAEQVLFAWTGNAETARIVAPVLFWYGLANALIGILIIPFMLQFAHGYLRLHVIGNLLLAITLLPVLIYASIRYGGVGAGAALLVSRLLFLFLWVPLVHRRFLADVVWTWPLLDVGKPAAAILLLLVLVQGILPAIENRLLAIVAIGVILIVSLSAGFLTGDRLRKSLTGLLGNRP